MSLMTLLEHIPEFDKSPNFKGKYDSTIGDKFEFTFGSQFDHIFGGEVKIFCDPIELLGGGNPVFSAVAAMLLGASGNTDLVFGSDTSVTYVGPVFEIKRARVFEKNTSEKASLLDPVDGPTSALAVALSVLICATAFAIDMAMHFKYPKYGSEKPEDEKEAESYGKTPRVLKEICIELISRLVALLRIVECWSAKANYGVNEVSLGTSITEAAASVANGARPVIMFIPNCVAAAREFFSNPLGLDFSDLEF